MVLNSYIPFNLEQGKSIGEEIKTMMLHMINNNRPSYWNSNKCEHPATSNTIATDFDMNKALVDDYIKKGIL